MPIFGVKSSFLELGILVIQKRELIIEEVHTKEKKYCKKLKGLKTVSLQFLTLLTFEKIRDTGILIS